MEPGIARHDLAICPPDRKSLGYRRSTHGDTGRGWKQPEWLQSSFFAIESVA